MWYKGKRIGLKGKLDRLFSEYIRRRDADYAGYCRCVTCGKVQHWREMDAGHFVPRDRIATRWDETNVHPQCRECNRFRSGKQYEHGMAIDRIHGPGTAARLWAVGNARGAKISAFQMEELIESVKACIKMLKRLD